VGRSTERGGHPAARRVHIEPKFDRSPGAPGREHPKYACRYASSAGDRLAIGSNCRQFSAGAA